LPSVAQGSDDKVASLLCSLAKESVPTLDHQVVRFQHHIAIDDSNMDFHLHTLDMWRLYSSVGTSRAGSDSTNGSKKGCGITIDPLKHQLSPASSVQWFPLANDLMPLYNPKLIIGLQPERFTEDVGHPLPLLQISYVFQREALPQELMLKNVSSLDPIKATKEMLH